MLDKKRCKDLIDEAWARRRLDISRLLNGECEEDESIFDLGLSFAWIPPTGETYEEGGYFQLLLSWGGPSDEIRFFDYNRIVYVYMDWFDGAEIDISKDEVAREMRYVYEDVEAVDFERYRDNDRFALLGGG